MWRGFITSSCFLVTIDINTNFKYLVSDGWSNWCLYGSLWLCFSISNHCKFIGFLTWWRMTCSDHIIKTLVVFLPSQRVCACESVFVCTPVGEDCPLLSVFVQWCVTHHVWLSEFIWMSWLAEIEPWMHEWVTVGPAAWTFPAYYDEWVSNTPTDTYVDHAWGCGGVCISRSEDIASLAF